MAINNLNNNTTNAFKYYHRQRGVITVRIYCKTLNLKPILTRILNILEQREKIKLVKLVLLDLLMGILDVAFLGMTLIVINFYTSIGNNSKLWLLPAPFLNKNSLLLIGVFLVMFGFKNWLGYINTKLQQHFFYGISSRLSKRNLQHYLKDDYLRFINIDSSVLIRKISQQPIEFSNYILTNVQQIIAQTLLIVFTITGILFWQPGLFFLLFLLLLPPVFLLSNLVRNKLKAIRANMQVVSQKAIQHLQESLSGYVESNIYQKDDFFTARYYRHQLQLNNNIATQQTLQGLTSRLVEVFAILGFFILIAINKLSPGAPPVSLLTIGVFMAAAYKIIPGMVKILNSASQIKTYQFTITDLQPPEQLAVQAENADVINAVKFDGVAFKYRDHHIINNLSFSLQAGDMVGLSAQSGKGKTTIINLLLGFLKQNEGSIYINDAKTTQAQRQAYWRRISYIKQQPFIIHDTILKNITLSDEEHNADRLNYVVEFCGLSTITAQYPEGMLHAISEHGKNISGGQRQRIMLARALYHDFDVLVLDEAFAEMDDAAEREILGKLKLLAQQGKIIILITHNEASLAFCDRIITIDMEYA